MLLRIIIIPIQKRLSFITMAALFFLSIPFSCSEKEDPIARIDQVILYLTGNGNRYWKIQELYSNGTKVALTATQMTYFKTYTIGVNNSGDRDSIGTFSDADGYKGTWTMINTDHMFETVDNNPGGGLIKTIVTIKEIDPFKLDIEYSANAKTTRIVFFAH